MRYTRIRQPIITATQFKADGSQPWPEQVFTYNGVPYITIDGGNTPIWDNEWVVNENGDVSLYSDEDFQATFALADVQDAIVTEVVETPSEVIDEPMPDVVEEVIPVTVVNE
jgi:hypothetical protein